MNREASQFDARSKAWTPSHKAASNKLAVFQTLSGSARLGRCDGLVFIMLFSFSYLAPFGVRGTRYRPSKIQPFRI